MTIGILGLGVFAKIIDSVIRWMYYKNKVNTREGRNMPTYEFRCRKCAHQFSVKVSIGERKNVKCPQCGQGELTQLFTSVNIMGTGGSGCYSPLGSRFT